MLLIATMDTKGKEALFIRECLVEAGTAVVLMDAGIMGESEAPVDVSRHQVAAASGRSIEEVRAIGHEGKAAEAMIEGAARLTDELYRAGRIDGIISLGGSMGTTIGTSVMRSMPVGFPKLMVSTMASRNTRPFVATRDIAMLHSVCDLSGLNRLTAKVLRNGAMAMAGMVRYPHPDLPAGKPLVILSTLGTTEAPARALQKALEDKGREVVIFHTNGSGGQALEEMVEAESPELVVDLSLHELADHHFGGDYDAGPGRGQASLRKGIPTVLVPGNIDFLVTGPLSQALERFPGRAHHGHNRAITCIKTSPEEMGALATAIRDLCNSAAGAVALLVPMGGFSAFDRPDGPFWDPSGHRIFAERASRGLSPAVRFLSLPYHVNDPAFAERLIAVAEGLFEEHL